MLKKGLLSCNQPGAEGCGMRDEVVVGLSLPLPQAGQSLLMELRLPDNFWILLQIPSMRKCGFIPGPKDISPSSRKSHVTRCNPTSMWELPAVCNGLRLLPGQVNSKARNQPITPSTNKTFPAFYLHKLCLFSRAEGAGTSPCLFNPLQKSASPAVLPRTDQTLSSDPDCTFFSFPKLI